MLYTNIDVLRPAKITFDAGATNLLIVNNAVTQPQEYGHKNEFFNQSPKNIKQNTDSLPLFCLAALNEDIVNKEFFKNVSIHINSTNKNDDFFLIQPLLPDTVNALCKRYDADVVLSLDRFKVNDKIAELHYSDVNSYYMALVARYETQWSVHYPGNNKYTSATFRDTIYWDKESANRREALASLPERKDALVDGALYVGQNMIKRLIPYWEKNERYFFSNSNKKMKEGMDSVYAKKWDGAIHIWKSAIPSAGNSLKAKLANNIAIAYEIKGDIRNALDYAIQSFSFIKSATLTDEKTISFISNYVKQLSKRKSEAELIEKQLGE
jgi:hypothetical protein